jgi:large subunit ribosomal protein L29
MSKATEIRQLPSREILGAIENAKEELFKLRFQKEVGQLEDPTRINELKREIARYKTILRERQLAEQQVRIEKSDSDAK